jgi:hypothetical protein
MLETATRASWAATLVFLVSSLLVVGVRSWWSGGADIALIVLTFAWFLLSTRERGADDRWLGVAAGADGRPEGGPAPPPVAG